jgi:hypothetical protein
MSQAMNANLDPTLANRYLAEKLSLSEQERHDYEALLVSSPDAVSELEATARLKVGLAKLRETGELKNLLQQPAPSLPTFVMPLAAALAAVAIGATLWWSTLFPIRTAPLLFASHTSLVEKAGHSLPIGVTAAFFSKRTAESPVERYEKPASPAALVLRVRPTSLNRSHTYRLSLSRLGDTAFEVLAEINNLTPTAEDGFIECYADAARLTPGHYQVIVTDQATHPGPARPDIFMFDLIAK